MMYCGYWWLARDGKYTVKVLETKGKWFGVTKKQDKESVLQHFKKLIENGVNREDLYSDFRKRREESLLSKKTLQRYIQMCDEVISSRDTAKAKELQDEILASLCNDIAHLKNGLTNYSFIGAFTSGSTGHTTVVGDDVDYIKDAKLLKSKLMVEYEKIGDTMENLQDQESAEKVHKLFISLISRTQTENFIRL